MATPPFVTDLRAHIGTQLLWLPGVTAYILRQQEHEQKPEVLLVRRSDNGRWTPVTGICDPGEDPDTAAAREAWEETGVRIEVQRLVWVCALKPMRYDNGDECQFLDHAFVCRPISGTAHVADEESTEVGWFSVTDLPPLQPRFRTQLARIVAGDDGRGVLFGEQQRPR